MKLKTVKEEWFQDYKTPSTMIAFPICTFKCDKECGKKICQNSELAAEPNIIEPASSIVERYLSNPIPQAIVCGGLEPLDSIDDLLEFIKTLREDYRCNDTVVIYTGYYESEVQNELEKLKKFPNLIVKFGRFIPDKPKHYDEILGVYLASPNQYAKRIS